MHDRTVETQGSSGCEICEGRLQPDGYQLLGPGTCQGRPPGGGHKPQDTTGIVALNRTRVQCRDACARLTDCVGYSYYNCSGTTACVVHALLSTDSSTPDGWQRWARGSPELRLASGGPSCWECYSAMSQDLPVLETDFAPRSCAAQAASVRSFGTGALAAHQCRAVCSTAAKCSGWRFYLDGIICPVLSMPAGRVCIIWTRDMSWSPGFGFERLGSSGALPRSCCVAQGHRKWNVTRFSLPNVCADPAIHWPQMAIYQCRFGTLGATGASSRTQHLQYMLENMQIWVYGSVEVPGFVYTTICCCCCSGSGDVGEVENWLAPRGITAVA